MSLRVTSTSPPHWKYISEGGSTMVFSYVGPAKQGFSGTVLRLRKAPHTTMQASSPPLQMGDTHAEEPDDPTIVFQHRVIQRLIAAEFLPHLEPVGLYEPWLRELQSLSLNKRPEERRAKDDIDTRRTKGVLATDLVGGEGFVVELKPKWGFLPSPAHLSTQNKLVKTTTCRFCMHAHLKSTEGKEVSLGYCPLDLFSGDEARVTKALHALWDAWIGSSGGVNNLRVFVDGNAVRPSSLPATLSPLAAQLFSPNENEPTLAEVRDKFTATILPALLETPVLQKLSNLQRTLDPLDIEGLSALWSAAQAAANVQVETTLGVVPGQTLSVPALGYGLEEPTLLDWDAFLDIYLAKHIKMDHEHPDIANLRYYCFAYLLSASFKDCSIIIRLQQSYKPKVTVIDLDVKPVDRLHRWALLDAEIVKAYEAIERPSSCIDRWDSPPS